LFVCFVPSLSSYHEKTTATLYFGRIRTRLGVVHFRLFLIFDFFSVNLLFFRSHQAEIIIVKRLIQERNNDVTKVRVEPRSRDNDYGCRQNDALTLSATLRTTIFASLLQQ